MHTELNRRDVLKTIGGAGLAAVFGARALDFLGEDAQAATTCLLTPEATEGPYWVENSLDPPRHPRGQGRAPSRPSLHGPEREDVQADRQGRRRNLALRRTWQLFGGERRLVALPARPPEVECAREGGVPDDLPGWYRGRTPHIHMKVSVGGNEVHTGQIFFNEQITAQVYKQAPYSSRGQYDTPHARDNIYEQAGGSTAQVKLAKRTGGLKGYVGTIAIGVVR